MGITVIKNTNRKLISEDEMLAFFSRNIGKELRQEVRTEVMDIQTLNKLKEERDNGDKITRSKNVQKYLSIPPAIDVVAKKMYGEKYWKRKNPNFKKFLDTDFGNGIKGEYFLTIPRNKL